MMIKPGRMGRGLIASLGLFGLWACLVRPIQLRAEGPSPPRWFQSSDSPQQQGTTGKRNRTELPIAGGGTLLVMYDRMESPKPGVIVADGHVHVVYEKIQMWADRLEYRHDSGEVRLEGKVRFVEGLQFINCARARYNIKSQVGTFWEATGRTSEELIFKAARLDKLDAETYRVQQGFITACQDAVPKWSFTLSSGTMKINRSVTTSHTVFKVKGIPILYTPWMRFPIDRRKRSSGLLLPSTGTSTSKGRTLSESFYLTLGRSADATVSLNYFSKRGYGYGVSLRTRPNESSHLNISNFFVDDRLNQGGSNFIADAEMNTSNGFRGVAALDLVTNFAFRQNFSDTFPAATNPLDNSVVFLTNNFGPHSVNFFYSRQETFFPVQSVLIRRAPVIQFKTLGHQLGKLPLFFYLDSSLESVKRRDQFVRTPKFLQRFDIFPRISFPLKRWLGFSLTPRLGVRETFYSDRADRTQPLGVGGQDLNRTYLQFELDLKAPALTRVFRHGDGRTWFKHWIQPTVTYRRINGIDQFQHILRFDEKDLVTDTNELEYGLINRIFIKRDSGQSSVTHEFLSLKVSQQYFFDTSFGGALQNDPLGRIEPFTRLTAFSSGVRPNQFSPVVTSLRITPNDTVSLDLQLDYDVHLNRIRASGVSGFARLGRIFAATTFFVTKKLDEGSFESNQLQTQIGYGNPSRGFSASVTSSYDIHRSLLLNTQTRLNYTWDCCGVALEFQQFDTLLRNETQFRFSFSLKGLGHFGTLRRPQSLF